MSNLQDMPTCAREAAAEPPVSSIEPSLRHISHQLDRIVIDTQNIKSDLMYIKLYIDTQKQKNQTHSNDEISKGWFFNHR
tara:strand:- start:146 stop:385 length:240 start_codon:yes stop_codon:yes gene_type:complete